MNIYTRLHKSALEALTCLLESCTAAEAGVVRKFHSSCFCTKVEAWTKLLEFVPRGRGKSNEKLFCAFCSAAVGLHKFTQEGVACLLKPCNVAETKVVKASAGTALEKTLRVSPDSLGGRSDVQVRFEALCILEALRTDTSRKDALVLQRLPKTLWHGICRWWRRQVATGGDWWLRRRLRGWLWLSWSYARRVKAVQAVHATEPKALAYQQVG